MTRARHVKWLLAIVWIGALLRTATARFAVFELSASDRQEAFARAERDSSNLAHIIAEQVARAIVFCSAIWRSNASVRHPPRQSASPRNCGRFGSVA